MWLLATAGVVAVALSWQYAWWRPRFRLDAPRILMYHMVSLHKPGARFNKLRVEPDQFDRQIEWLVENGWNFAFMSELGPNPSTEKTVALTFDDGYRDNLLAADEVLKSYGVRATLYLVVDRHDREWSSLKNPRHDEGELRNEPKLLDSDVELMLESGRWELGSHSISHHPLPSLPANQRIAEVTDSRTRLQERFRVPVASFAYPFGIYDPQDVTAVASAGYRTAVTTEQGISDAQSGKALELKRIKVSGTDGMLAFRLRVRTGKCRWNDK